MDNITPEQFQEIGEIVCSHAFEIFKNAGYENDFCIQHIGGWVVVFGGTNRLIWNKGFYPDRRYCTPKFLECWDGQF